MTSRLFLSAFLSVLITSSAAAQTPGSSYEILALGGTNGPGVRPFAGLVLGPDGNYYGTASDGGALGGGTVFRLTPGGDLTPLVSFPYEEGNPREALIVGSDGNLYGTTEGAFAGTPNSKGTIFRVTLAGQLTTLATLVNSGAPVVAPQKLVESSDGNFYGTTAAGGAQRKGQVFRLSKDGALTILAEFVGSNGDSPQAGLIEAADGNFYGTTSIGGANNNGTVFRVTKAGVITTLASFPGTATGIFPQTELTQGPDGNLYGVTSSGGANFGGAVFRIALGGTLTGLAPLPQNNVAGPGPLVLGEDGNFYGTTVNDFYRVSLAGNLTVLANFPSTFEGRQAEGPLLKVGNGQFLGTTFSGGSIGRNELGTVHRLTEQGTVTPVVAFPRIVGRNFNSELTEGPDGHLYGTVADSGRRSPGASPRIPAPFKMSKAGSITPLRSFLTSQALSPAGRSSRMTDLGGGVLFGALSEGGVLTQPPPFPSTVPSGFIYRIGPDASVSTVYQFIGLGVPGDSPNEHGETPQSALTPGPNSQFYGTTAFGGAQARGTLFKIDGNGTLTTLASFNNSTGLAPSGNLIFSDGLFYGRTSFGGANDTGTFFSATPDGAITSLASFPPATFPNSLILATDGNFHGTTFAGGANNLGMVFRLTKSGVLSTVASMDTTTGSGPLGIIQAIDGKFYGVTRGNFQVPGAIFQITPGGVLTSLVRFDEARGTDPVANLIQGGDGHLYGTTAANGPARGGVVYRVILPPGQLVNVSTRLPVGRDDNALFEGFIIQGPAGSTKKLLIRGLGPFLGGFGLTGFLPNPTLDIFEGSNKVATNDDWRTTQIGGLITADQSQEIAGSGFAPTNEQESTIIANLAPGNFTAVVRGLGNTDGIGLVDAFDLSTASAAKVVNFATRGLVQPGDKLLTAGFIIQNGPVRAVIRAIGPSLIAFNITNALPDTTLQLRDQNGGLVQENDDWQTDQKAELEATGLQPTNIKEAALVRTIPPGQYTAQVRGKPETTGIGVVEIYFLQ